MQLSKQEALYAVQNEVPVGRETFPKAALFICLNKWSVNEAAT